MVALRHREEAVRRAGEEPDRQGAEVRGRQGVGRSTGSYTVRADSKDGKTATALWQNDTAVFEVTGSKESVLRFYEPFPL